MGIFKSKCQICFDHGMIRPLAQGWPRIFFSQAFSREVSRRTSVPCHQFPINGPRHSHNVTFFSKSNHRLGIQNKPFVLWLKLCARRLQSSGSGAHHTQAKLKTLFSFLLGSSCSFSFIQTQPENLLENLTCHPAEGGTCNTQGRETCDTITTWLNTRQRKKL